MLRRTRVSGQDSGLDLVPSRHRASDYLSQRPDVFGLFFVTRLAAGAITQSARIRECPHSRRAITRF